MMDRPDLLRRPSTPEKHGRSSFSSIREESSGPAQTFTSSKVSSYIHANDEAIIDSDDSASPPAIDMAEVQFLPPVTQPGSKLHGNWFPANNFRGWKQINVKGKTASRSFGDLQALHMAWSTPPAPKKEKNRYAHGHAPIEKLPIEILGTCNSAWPMYLSSIRRGKADPPTSQAPSSSSLSSMCRPRTAPVAAMLTSCLC